MRLIYAVLILLLALMTSAQCLTPEDYYNAAVDCYNKGVDLSYQGKYDEAIKAYEEAIKQYPLGAAWRNKGVALLNLGKYDEAIDAFDKAVGISDEIIKTSYEAPTIENREDLMGVKGTALAYKGTALVDKGSTFTNQRKYDEAIKAFDEAIKVSDEALRLDLPLNVDKNARKDVKGVALANKGRVLALKGLNLVNQSKYDEAIKVFDEAINASDEALKVGLTLDVHRNVEDGKGLVLAGKSVAVFGQGVDLVNQVKYDEAIKAFDEAIRLDPNFAMAWDSKGVALEALGQTTEADAAFAKAKELGYEG